MSLKNSNDTIGNRTRDLLVNHYATAPPSNHVTYKTNDRSHPYEIIMNYESYESEKICSSVLMCAGLGRKRKRNSVIMYINMFTVNSSWGKKVTIFTHTQHLIQFLQLFQYRLTTCFTRQKLCVWCELSAFTAFICFTEQTVIVSFKGNNWLVFSVDIVCFLRGSDWIFVY